MKLKLHQESHQMLVPSNPNDLNLFYWTMTKIKIQKIHNIMQFKLLTITIVTKIIKTM